MKRRAAFISSIFMVSMLPKKRLDGGNAQRKPFGKGGPKELCALVLQLDLGEGIPPGKVFFSFCL
jgi:hypothetical protein